MTEFEIATLELRRCFENCRKKRDRCAGDAVIVHHPANAGMTAFGLNSTDRAGWPFDAPAIRQGQVATRPYENGFPTLDLWQTLFYQESGFPGK